MMKPEIREERVRQYGSFLYCPEHNTLCFGIYTPDGVCRRSPCCLDDPEYLALQARIERNRKRNEALARQERRREKADPPAPIRNQSGAAMLTPAERAEQKAEEYYRANNPNMGDTYLNKAMRLRKGEQSRP